jgi:hypothetical protein
MAAPVVSSTEIGSGTSGSATVDKPTGVTSGDTLVIVMFSFNDGSVSGLTGWTNRTVAGTSTCQMDVFTREADGTEGASETLTQAAGNDVELIYARVTGGDYDGITVADPSRVDALSANPAFYAITTPADDALVLACAGWRTNQSLVSGPSGYTTEALQESPNGIAMFSNVVATEGEETPGATEINNSRWWASTSIAIGPAAGGGGTDALTADGIAATTSVGSPVAGAVSVLSGEGVESAANVAAPTIGQIHSLTSAELAATSEVDEAVVGQVHALTTGGIIAATAVGAPVCAQINALIADALNANASVAAPAIGQMHALIASNLTSSPNVQAADIGQVHALAAGGVDSSAEVGAPSAAQAHILSAGGLDVATEPGNPALGHVHVLAASNCTASTNVGLPAFGQSHALVTPGLDVAPTVGAPIISTDGVNALSATDITALTNVGSPNLSSWRVIMATISAAHDEPSIRTARIIFADVQTGDTIIPTLIGAARAFGGTVYMHGTWGGATVSLRGSIDGVNFFILEDKAGSAITMTEDGYAEFSTFVPYLDVAISGGTSDSVNIDLALPG